jgi:hypothetical protein
MSGSFLSILLLRIFMQEIDPHYGSVVDPDLESDPE